MKKLILLIVIVVILLGIYKVNTISNVDTRYNKFFNASKITLSESYTEENTALIINVFDGENIKENTALRYTTNLFASEIYQEYSQYENYDKVIVIFKSKTEPIFFVGDDEELLEVDEIVYEFDPNLDF